MIRIKDKQYFIYTLCKSGLIMDNICSSCGGVTGLAELKDGGVSLMHSFIREVIKLESLPKSITIDLGGVMQDCAFADRLKKETFYGKAVEILDAKNLSHTKLTDQDSIRVIHACLGVISEAGEILDADARHKPLTEEVGDLMWYVGVLIDVMDSRGIGLGTILHENIKKLQKRYPKGKFSSDDAIRRVDHDEKD